MVNFGAGHRTTVAYSGGEFKGETEFIYGSELESEDCHDDTKGTN
jgi:hypothetical protein